MIEMATDDVWVYVIGFKGKPSPCKIGMAKNPHKRLALLQISNPDELVIRAAYPFPDWHTARTAEKTIHYEFADKKIRGEWFRTTWMMACRAIVDICGMSFSELESDEKVCYPHASHDEKWERPNQ